jgi:hypothetical protein
MTTEVMYLHSGNVDATWIANELKKAGYIAPGYDVKNINYIKSSDLMDMIPILICGNGHDHGKSCFLSDLLYERNYNDHDYEGCEISKVVFDAHPDFSLLGGEDHDNENFKVRDDYLFGNHNRVVLRQHFCKEVRVFGSGIQYERGRLEFESQKTLKGISKIKKCDIHVSVDFDCLAQCQFVSRIWEGHGNLKFSQLRYGLDKLKENNNIVGLDMCGFDPSRIDHLKKGIWMYGQVIEMFA